MSNFKVVALAFAAAAALTLPGAMADEWNQKTTFKFSGPVEIPGRVLPAGTYVFKLLDSQGDRDIVQVFNKRENQLYGTFITIPDYRLKVRGKPIISFEERVANSPEAVKAWFYPGDNYGHEFVYPKVRAAELARANHQPVPAMPTEMAETTTKTITSKTQPEVMAMKQATLQAEKPNQEEGEIAESFPPQPPAATPATTETASARLPRRLPKTASPVPLIGLLGLMSLSGAGLLRFAGRRGRS